MHRRFEVCGFITQIPASLAWWDGCGKRFAVITAPVERFNPIDLTRSGNRSPQLNGSKTAGSLTDVEIDGVYAVGSPED